MNVAVQKQETFAMIFSMIVPSNDFHSHASYGSTHACVPDVTA